MKTINIVYQGLLEGIPKITDFIAKNNILPGSYYNAIDTLMKKGYIDEDLKIIKKLENKIPFYGFSDIEKNRYPRQYIISDIECDYITRIKGKISDIKTGTNIYVKNSKKPLNGRLFLINDITIKVKKLHYRYNKIWYYDIMYNKRYIEIDNILGLIVKTKYTR